MSDTKQVILSLFPGADLLGMGYEHSGFCVLRGPDLIFGRDVRHFSGEGLRGKVSGIIAGVPCQFFSNATKVKNRINHSDLWPEFWRIVGEVQPDWVQAENVKGAELASTSMFDVPHGYNPTVRTMLLSGLGSAQARPRMILFSSKGGKLDSAFWKSLETAGRKNGDAWRLLIGRDVVDSPRYATITGDKLEHRNRGTGKPARNIQGDDLLDAFDLPADYRFDPKNIYRLVNRTKARLITQGVPVAAAYAIAMSVKAAISGKDK